MVMVMTLLVVHGGRLGEKAPEPGIPFSTPSGFPSAGGLRLPEGSSSDAAFQVVLELSKGPAYEPPIWMDDQELTGLSSCAWTESLLWSASVLSVQTGIPMCLLGKVNTTMSPLLLGELQHSFIISQFIFSILKNKLYQ